MAGYDFSQISDEQLEATVDALMHDPIALRSTPVAQRQAAIAEYNRRRAARNAKPAAAPPAPAAPNVEANLEASAAPIAPDPVVGSRRAAPPQSYEEYAAQSDLYQRGIGLEPQDGYETDAEVEARFDAKFGRGAYKKHKKDTRVRDHGREYRAGIRAHLDARDAENQAARAAGYQDPEQVAYNEATGVPSPAPAAPGDYYDGTVVTAEDVDRMSDEQIVYNMRNTGANAGIVGEFARFTPEDIANHRAWMRDVNRIPGGRDQERFNPRGYRAAVAQREAMIRQQAQDNREKYGWGAPETLTAAQRQARAERSASEARAAGRPRRVESMLARMAERAGVSMEEAQAAWDAAVADKDNGINVEDGLTPDEIFKGTKSLRAKATTRQAAARQSQQDDIALRRKARYNPVAALGDDSGLNDWQKMVVADAMLRGGQQGPTPLGVQAVGGQNALRMLQGINLGQGMQNNPLVQAQAEAAGIQAQAARDEARSPDEDVLGNKYAPSGWFGYDEFTVEEQQQMYDDLIRRGYTPADAQRAVDRQADKRRATDRADWGE